MFSLRSNDLWLFSMSAISVCIVSHEKKKTQTSRSLKSKTKQFSMQKMLMPWSWIGHLLTTQNAIKLFQKNNYAACFSKCHFNYSVYWPTENDHRTIRTFFFNFILVLSLPFASFFPNQQQLKKKPRK